MNEKGFWYQFGSGIGGIIAIVFAVVLTSFAVSVLWSLAEWWRALFGWG